MAEAPASRVRAPDVVLLWGLAGGRRHAGSQLQPHLLLTCGGAWNPPTHGQQQLRLPVPPAGAAQLAVGWERALLAASDGRAFAAATERLLDSEADGQQLQQEEEQQAQQDSSPGACWQQLQLVLPHPPLHGARTAVRQLAAGDAHCLLLTASGTVWALGADRYGQLGCSEQQAAPAAAEPAAGSGRQQPQPVLGPDAPGSACTEPLRQARVLALLLACGDGAGSRGGSLPRAP